MVTLYKILKLEPELRRKNTTQKGCHNLASTTIQFFFDFVTTC